MGEEATGRENLLDIQTLYGRAHILRKEVGEEAPNIQACDPFSKGGKKAWGGGHVEAGGDYCKC